jgi:hypothetical protein
MRREWPSVVTKQQRQTDQQAHPPLKRNKQAEEKHTRWKPSLRPSRLGSATCSNKHT